MTKNRKSVPNQRLWLLLQGRIQSHINNFPSQFFTNLLHFFKGWGPGHILVLYHLPDSRGGRGETLFCRRKFEVILFILIGTRSVIHGKKGGGSFLKKISVIFRILHFLPIVFFLHFYYALVSQKCDKLN